MVSFFQLVAIVCSLCALGVLSEVKTYYIEDEAYLQNAWNDFKVKYKRNHFHEDGARFEIFKQNLRVIDERNRNALQNSSKHDVHLREK